MFMVGYILFNSTSYENLKYSVDFHFPLLSFFCPDFTSRSCTFTVYHMFNFSCTPGQPSDAYCRRGKDYNWGDIRKSNNCRRKVCILLSSIKLRKVTLFTNVGRFPISLIGGVGLWRALSLQLFCIFYWKTPASSPEHLMKHSIMLTGAFR